MWGLAHPVERLPPRLENFIFCRCGAPSAKADTGDEEERTEYVAMLEQRPLLPRAAQSAAEP